MLSDRAKRKLPRRIAAVLVVFLVVYLFPWLVVFFLLCGFVDVMRHKDITPFLLKRYFMGNGILTMLMAPLNLLADLFSFKNKIIYKIDDLPEDYQKEIMEVVDIFKEKKDDIMESMDKRLAESGRGMLFIKWYDKVMEQSIVDYNVETKYIKTVAVSAFNKGQKTKLHFGPLRLSLRVLYNLNPIQNDQIYIEANGVKHYWHDDPLFIFDDTVMHESANNSQDQIRYCLFMDIVRPSDHYEAFNFLIGKLSIILNNIKGIFYKNWKTIS
ncbi:MAG: aspartyl/asparaginyl beta-hydroxylase [Micavibrio sp.]|nr:MAG: aspartyl/asparaginyl beta-hydroxylase [Micavibrio sp.]